MLCKSDSYDRLSREASLKTYLSKGLKKAMELYRQTTVDTHSG